MKMIREGDLARNDNKASCSHCKKTAQNSGSAFWGQLGFKYLCTPCADLHQKRAI